MAYGVLSRRKPTRPAFLAAGLQAPILAARTLRSWFDSTHPGRDASNADTAATSGTSIRHRIDWHRLMPFFAVHAGCLLALQVGVSAVAVGTAVALYVLRMFAITAIYHRYFSHHAFKMTRVPQFVFAVIGCMAAQRGPLWWSAHHRQHHAKADREGDPHSPRRHGFWRSHMGWFMVREHFRTRFDFVPEWARFPELRLLDRFDVVPPLLLAALLWGAGSVLARHAPGLGATGPQMVVWGFCVSTVALYHATFSINSCAHRFGRRRYATNDDSRNNLWLAIVTMGEGWHNNHHHFPGAARQGFYWWELDPTYYVLRCLRALRVVRELKPVPARMLTARMEPGPTAPGPARAARREIEHVPATRLPTRTPSIASETFDIEGAPMTETFTTVLLATSATLNINSVPMTSSRCATPLSEPAVHDIASVGVSETRAVTPALGPVVPDARRTNAAGADLALPSRSMQRPIEAAAALSERLARLLVLSCLEGLKCGRLTLVEGRTTRVFGDCTPDCNHEATVHVTNPQFYKDIAFGGSVGAGEAFIRGRWKADDLTAAIRIMLSNRHVMDDMEAGWARVATPARIALHRMARNTRRGSARNIAAHYDLGNDYFRLVLGPAMMYSCARFEQPGDSLAQAEEANLDSVCRKLDLGPGDHVVEIGTGWGGFALHAAGRYGCRVTTTTISREQCELARDRIAAAGMSDRITVLLQDYRDLRGQYDKLVSIEMVEHVGHKYYKQYFAQCASLLKPHGRMYLQSSTINERRYGPALRSVDFIQRYIFPGCCIPSVSTLCQSAGMCDLTLIDFEDTAMHYATTLRAWRDNMLANADIIRQLGYPDTLINTWRFYFAYCDAGFSERALGAAQMVFVKSAGV